MKLFLFGDSFAANYKGWPNMLGVEIENFSQNGIGQYKIFKKVMQNLNFDKSIICHTSPWRVHTRVHPIHKNSQDRPNNDFLLNDVEYHSKEHGEMKLVNETKKILNIECKISPTCIRVPTLRSHCISLNVEFNKELSKEDILNKLNNFIGVKLYNFPDENKFPEPIFTSGKTDVYVGRIRPDIDDLKCWNFFISGDQLLKGAGYNSVQILKHLLDNN